MYHDDDDDEYPYEDDDIDIDGLNSFINENGYEYPQEEVYPQEDEYPQENNGYKLPHEDWDFQFQEGEGEGEGEEGEGEGEEGEEENLFSSKLKINFFKLSDYNDDDDDDDDDDEWKNLVKLALSHVKFGCIERTNSNGLLLIVYIDKDKIIQPNPTLSYEYVSLQDIPYDKDLFKLITFPFLEEEEEEEEDDDDEELLLSIFEYLKKLKGEDDGNYYFHFTCNDFEYTIIQQGLIVKPPIRIMDYSDEEDEDDEDTLGGKKINKSYKKNKNKSYKKNKNKSYKKNKNKSYKKNKNKSYKKNKNKSYKKNKNKSYKKNKNKSYKNKSYKNKSYKK